METKPDKLLPALYGGIIMAILSTVPGLNLLNCLCCAGIMLGGFFGVFFYRQEILGTSYLLTPGDAAVIGLLSGVFGALVGMLLSIAINLLFGNVGAKLVFSIIEQWNLTLPPEAEESIRESLERSLTVSALIFSFFASLILDSIFGVFGGLIGYALLKPQTKQVSPPPQGPSAAA